MFHYSSLFNAARTNQLKYVKTTGLNPLFKSSLTAFANSLLNERNVLKSKGKKIGIIIVIYSFKSKFLNWFSPIKFPHSEHLKLHQNFKFLAGHRNTFFLQMIFLKNNASRLFYTSALAISGI